MADAFLPDNYEVPQSSGKYMKFQIGENRFRILSRPIIGNEGWKEDQDGRHSVRKRMTETFQPNEINPDEPIKHFWAMPVYSFREKRIQVLEITQKTILRSIQSLSKDPDWGSPATYDIVVSRVGNQLDTEYSVTPKPKSPLDRAILDEWADVSVDFDLDRLFDGGDPFGEKDQPLSPHAQTMKRAKAEAKGEGTPPSESTEPATSNDPDPEIRPEDIPF